MPGRGEFDVEYENDAEQVVKEILFDENEPADDVLLKTTVLDIYNKVLTERLLRKKFIFSRNLTDFKRIQLIEKKRPRLEKEMHAKLRPFARMIKQSDYDSTITSLITESKLRLRISQFQEYRKMGLTSLSQVSEYEQAKNAKSSIFKAQVPQRKHEASPPPSRKPSASLDVSGSEAYELLSPQEQILCSNLRILPRAYLVIKETLISEFQKSGGSLKKRGARGLVKIDVNKTGKVWDFFVSMGWLC